MSEMRFCIWKPGGREAARAIFGRAMIKPVALKKRFLRRWKVCGGAGGIWRPDISVFQLHFLPQIRQPVGMAKNAAVKWTREHLLIALNLYCKLPFGSFHHRNAIIKETAEKMGRSTNSLAMKLSNFASLDPVHHARGVKGLEGASRQDRAIWDEFHANLSMLGEESEQRMHDLFTHDERQEVDFLARDKVRLVTPDAPTESQATVKVRRGQQFFRQTVLNSYNIRCCISGINVPRLLVASHIKPWSKFPTERLNPRNGLCLSSLHDAAFDNGLITLDQDLKVVLSNRLRKFFPQPALEQNFLPYQG